MIGAAALQCLVQQPLASGHSTSCRLLRAAVGQRPLQQQIIGKLGWDPKANCTPCRGAGVCAWVDCHRVYRCMIFCLFVLQRGQ
jgi:hypothetical protein